MKNTKTHVRMTSARSLVFCMVVTAVPVGSVAAQFCPFKVQARSALFSPLNAASEVASQSVATRRYSTGSSQVSAYARATSRVSGLSGTCGVVSGQAVTWISEARSRWSYPGLSFPARTRQAILAQLQLVSTGSRSGKYSPHYSLDVTLFDDALGQQVAQHQLTNLVPGAPLSALIMNVTTNTTYRLEVDVTVWALANQSAESISNHLTFAPQPFVLPAGVSAESKWAQIASSSFNPLAPAIELEMWMPSPLIGGAPSTVRYSQSALMAAPPMLLVGVGTAPPCNVSIGPNFGLSVIGPVIVVQFNPDPNLKTARITFPVPASATGAKIVFQAAQVTGPSLVNLYSSNAESIVVH